MRLGTPLKYFGGFLLAVLLLGWVLREADPAAVWDSLGQVSFAGLALFAGLNFVHITFRVWRWRALLAPVREGIAFRPMFSSVVLGYTVSWIIPGRLGEVVRPALLAARERLPFGPCLGSVVADRLLDGVAVLVLFAVGILVTPLSGEALRHATEIRKWSLVLVAVVALPIAVMIAVSTQRERFERFLSGGGRLRTWFRTTAVALSRGSEALHRPRLLLIVVLHTFAAWLTIALATWVGVRACGAQVSFGGVLVVQPLLVLGIALPTPGGAGGYHAGMVFGLTRLFDVAEPVAVGAAFLMHAATILPVVVAGVVFLVAERIPFGDLLRVGRDRATAAGSATELAPTPPAGPRP